MSQAERAERRPRVAVTATPDRTDTSTAGYARMCASISVATAWVASRTFASRSPSAGTRIGGPHSTAKPSCRRDRRSTASAARRTRAPAARACAGNTSAARRTTPRRSPCPSGDRAACATTRFCCRRPPNPQRRFEVLADFDRLDAELARACRDAAGDRAGLASVGDHRQRDTS